MTVVHSQSHGETRIELSYSFGIAVRSGFLVLTLLFGVMAFFVYRFRPSELEFLKPACLSVLALMFGLGRVVWSITPGRRIRFQFRYGGAFRFLEDNFRFHHPFDRDSRKLERKHRDPIQGFGREITRMYREIRRCAGGGKDCRFVFAR